MYEYEVDLMPYHHILYALIGHKDNDPDRIPEVVAWVQANVALLKRVLPAAERALLSTFLRFWTKHKAAPDRDGLEELVRSAQQPAAQLAVLETFDKNEADLTLKDPVALHHQLDMLSDDFEKKKLTEILNQALHIAVGSVSLPDPAGKHGKKKMSYTGPSGCLRYLYERMQAGILVNGVQTQGSLLADTAHLIEQAVQPGRSPIARTMTYSFRLAFA